MAVAVVAAPVPVVEIEVTETVGAMEREREAVIAPVTNSEDVAFAGDVRVEAGWARSKTTSTVGVLQEA